MVIAQMIFQTFPAVKAQLGEYRERLSNIHGPLAKQGLDSIRDKEFHCLGGSVYALLAPGGKRQEVLRFIVAFQTISDYLDNLCDRFGIYSEPVFRQLHTAMLDSLEPGATGHSDYYATFPYQDDGGYLRMLVDDCRFALKHVPFHCHDRAVELTKLYIHLQSYKHMERKAGEAHLEDLYNQAQAPNLFWWEFAAACGSTLGVFTMVAAGGKPNPLYKAYMPWVQGLHILLDYFIDQEEDREHSDMNLVSYYGKLEHQNRRLLWFYHRAKAAVRPLAKNRFHALVLDGLLALYLSDPKALAPELIQSRNKLLQGAGLRARVLERMARILRGRRVI